MKRLLKRIRNTFRYTQTLSKTHPFTFTALIAATAFGLVLSLLDGVLERVEWIESHSRSIGEVFLHLLLWAIMVLFAVFLLENLVKK